MTAIRRVGIRWIIQLALFAAVIVQPILLYGQSTVFDQLSSSESCRISLLTCGPGDEVYTVYGHSAIRIWDPELAIDIVFNYGTFDFDQPNFLLKFIRGKLPYTLSVSDIGNFLRAYKHDHRKVVENEFLLDSIQKAAFLQFIVTNYEPQNREYAYDFFFDNCSSRIWDVVDISVEEPIELPKNKAELSFRDMITLYQQDMPWTDFGIDLIIGSPADVRTTIVDQMFLPDFLQEHMEASRIQGEKLLGPERVLIQSDTVIKGNRSIFTPTHLMLLLILCELIFLLSGMHTNWLVWLDRLWFLLLSVIGLLLLFMWLFTDHQACHQNYHLVWASPLYLILLAGNMIEPYKQPLYRVLLIGCFIGMTGVIGWLPQAMPWSIGLMIIVTILKLLRHIRLPQRNLNLAGV